MQPSDQQPAAPSTPPLPSTADTAPITTSGTDKSKRYLIGAWALVGVAVILVAGALWLYLHPAATKTTVATTSIIKATQPATSPTPQTPAVTGVQLDATKKYGNLYANGLLPVGDNKYVTDGAKTGYIYTCSGYAQNLTGGQGGAGSRGPWFVGTTQYDITKKAHVSGGVMWQSSVNTTLSGTTRTITTNDLPTHRTGIYPIASSDPAYAYDRNPNSIKGQQYTFALPASQTYGDPSCMGGQVGIMLTGATLFNAFDAGGRDAGAWEVQDDCGGHPEKQGEYHYHTLSSCITDTSVHTVIGFALDGFPITGAKVSTSDILTTRDLDECHGLTSSIVLDGKTVTSYHYVMTQDFPYSASCFRGHAIQPPGLQQAGPQQPRRP